MAVVSVGTWYDWTSRSNNATGENSSSEAAWTSAADVAARAASMDADVTGLLEAQCSFADHAQRAAFNAALYEEVYLQLRG